MKQWKSTAFAAMLVMSSPFGGAWAQAYEEAGSSEVEPNTQSAASSDDPWEGFNRAMFGFNNVLDKALVKPLAQGYVWITPDPIETGVNNVFSNLGEVGNVLNDILQWKWKQAANDTGRFLVNSTIGVVGFFDVAKKMGMERSDGEDFGQTLAAWGVGQGPYMVLPLFGPSTLRDAAGFPVDWSTSPVNHIDDRSTSNTLNVVGLVNARASLLEAEKLMSGDRYVFMRDAFLQRRNYLIDDGVVEDDFGSDDDEYGDEYDF
ncbi:VacJ family lipoprotein [Marinibactrum halimedae]|uniref:Lipoprotein n=1 Tax=Marinibactrum halimedae TaxID=1444977 RepID=A0AA37T0S3_9GAMM|nr:VacJ family lipoprotein [Marinibactrum halimedae]MCD9459132.1 VacJ family lipoprotein [Marinibactrum halimedae]GLS24734.1 lipoprotein [Marinibactrum halimedae]